MHYDRRTKNQWQELPAGKFTPGARRDKPEWFVDLFLPFVLSHTVGRVLPSGCDDYGAPGTAHSHPTPPHTTKQQSQPQDTALPKGPRTTEAPSSFCQADNRHSSEGYNIFNNHLVIIIMQKRDMAVNRCNCCIYPWYVLTVQSLSITRFIRVHLRWFVAVEETGKEQLILVKDI